MGASLETINRVWRSIANHLGPLVEIAKLAATDRGAGPTPATTEPRTGTWVIPPGAGACVPQIMIPRAVE